MNKSFFVTLMTKMWISERVGRYSFATGKTFVEGLIDLKGIGMAVIWVMIMPLLVIQFFSGHGWPLGVGASVMGMFFDTGHIPVVGMRVVATIVVVAIWYLLVVHTYDILEKVIVWIVLGVLVPSVGIAVIALGPDWRTLLALFDISPLWTHFAKNGADLAYIGNSLAWCGSGMVGMAAYSYWVIEKGYHRGQSDSTKRIVLSPKSFKEWTKVYLFDIYGGYIVVFVVAALIMLNSVLVLHPYGLVPKGTDVMIISASQLTIPLGEWAKYLWLIGTASTLFVTPMAYYDGSARLATDAVRHVFPGIAKKYSFHQVRKALTSFFCIGAILMIWGLSPLGPYPLKVVSAFAYIDGLPYMVLLAIFSVVLVQKFVQPDMRGNMVNMWGACITAVLFTWFTINFQIYGVGFFTFLKG